MSYQLSAPIKRYNYLSAETAAAYHEVAVKLGLSDSVMMVLYIIYDRGGVCLLGEIPRLSGIPKQTVNSALRKMESDGILRMEAVDGKKKKVHLTEAGMTLAEGTVLRLMALEDAVFAGWSQEEQKTYLALTQRYLEEFREKTKEL